MDLCVYGAKEYLKYETEDQTLARITAVHKERYELVTRYGEGYGRLKTGIFYNGGNMEFPTVGDFVLLQYNPVGDSQVVETLPRRTFFSRKNPTPGMGEQAIAANFDTVFIMQSLNHDFNSKRLERYAIQAWQSGAQPVVVLTKADLSEDFDWHIRETKAAAAGIPVVPVSAFTGFGLDELSEYVKPAGTIVCLGSSGIGKSSLVNALSGQEIMKINDIREGDDKGKHTTTHRQLILLPSGAMMIDTPGMRELGMWDVSVGLSETFGEVEELLGKCRFSNCRHQEEPGCAILAALESGELDQKRWKRFLQLKKEARYSDVKAASMMRRQQKNKDTAKYKRKDLKSSGAWEE